MFELCMCRYIWCVNVKQMRFVDPFQSSFLDHLMSNCMAWFLHTRKHFSLVFDLLYYLLSGSRYLRINFCTRRTRRWTKRDFATCPFHTLAMPVAHTGGTVTFCLCSKMTGKALLWLKDTFLWRYALAMCNKVRSVRRPFCFCGTPN